MQDIFFEYNYGKLYEDFYKGKTEVFNFTDDYGTITSLFVKRLIDINLGDGESYYDLITPYGYGGPIIQDYQEGKKEALLDNFYKAFKEYCHQNNIVSEFIRFHPLLDNAKDFENIFRVEYLRNTVATNLKDYDDPVQAEFSRSARKTLRKSLRDGVTYEIIENPDSFDEFISIYYETMRRTSASENYFFDQTYFEKCLEYFKEHILLVKAIFENKTIGMSFLFKYNHFLHGHLTGTLNEYLNLSPSNVMQYATVLYGKENGYHYIHYGGGLSNDNDSLFKFKKRFGQHTEFSFSVGKNIWNPEVYQAMVAKKGIVTNDDFFPLYRLND